MSGDLCLWATGDKLLLWLPHIDVSLVKLVGMVRAKLVGEIGPVVMVAPVNNLIGTPGGGESPSGGEGALNTANCAHIKLQRYISCSYDNRIIMKKKMMMITSSFKMTNFLLAEEFTEGSGSGLICLAAEAT